MKIKTAYFGDVEINLEDDVPTDDPVLLEFRKLGAEDRLRDTRHVFAYYRDTHGRTGWEDLDQHMGVPASEDSIWDHVSPGHMFVEDGYPGDPCRYLVVEAECAWEVEHGLMMVWREGRTLCKVGPYDGHLTNSDALADKALGGVVFKAIDESLTTYETGPNRDEA